MSPEQLVQKQLDAFNAKDIEALLGTYAPDAEHYVLHGQLLAKGREQLRPRFLLRFSEPDLFAKLLSRTSMGPIVIDHEVITRNFEKGLGTLEMLCIYEVKVDQIMKATFAVGPERYE
jgi:hypothetical protein